MAFKSSTLKNGDSKVLWTKSIRYACNLWYHR
nr:MAG TPA: hypothetical protein [Caudoviricetes sp.]